MAQMCGEGDGVCSSWQKISLLEAENESLRRQVQVLAVEISLVLESLGKNLGLSVVNRDSFYFNALHGSEGSEQIENIKRSLALVSPVTNEGDSRLEVRVVREELSQNAPINLENQKRVEPLTVEVDTVPNVEKHFRGREDASDIGEEDNQDNLDSQIMVNDSGSETQSGRKDPGSSEIEAQYVTRMRPKSVKKLGSLKKNTRRQFKCRYCKSAFKEARHRNDHERIHTGEKPYKCRICDKWYRTTGSRGRHERTHTVVKDNKDQPKELDNLGGKMETQDSEAETQIPLAAARCRRQKSAKSHKCQGCNASFKKTSAKTYHEPLHAGKKPYKCRFCTKTFARRDQQVIHQRGHTDKKPYKCRFCDKPFAGREHQSTSSHMNGSTLEKGRTFAGYVIRGSNKRQHGSRT